MFLIIIIKACVQYCFLFLFDTDEGSISQNNDVIHGQAEGQTDLREERKEDVTAVITRTGFPRLCQRQSEGEETLQEALYGWQGAHGTNWSGTESLNAKSSSMNPSAKGQGAMEYANLGKRHRRNC